MSNEMTQPDAVDQISRAAALANAGDKLTIAMGECSPRAMRDSAKSVLRDLIERHRRAANEYELLLHAMPDQVPPEHDEALYHLLCRLPRP